MQKLTLELEHSYALIGIHSSEEDYRLAFLINKNLKTSFSKFKESLDFENSNACFSIFLFEDKCTCTSQFLIANKHVGKSKNKTTNILFGNTVSETNYLIPEKKSVDFFLKIEGDVSQNCIQNIAQQINKIPQVLTCYTIDASILKSKDALIF